MTDPGRAFAELLLPQLVTLTDDDLKAVAAAPRPVQAPTDEIFDALLPESRGKLIELLTVAVAQLRGP